MCGCRSNRVRRCSVLYTKVNSDGKYLLMKTSDWYLTKKLWNRHDYGRHIGHVLYKLTTTTRKTCQVRISVGTTTIFSPPAYELLHPNRIKERNVPLFFFQRFFFFNNILPSFFYRNDTYLISTFYFLRNKLVFFCFIGFVCPNHIMLFFRDLTEIY